MKLRSLALGSVASVALLAGSALAADLPVRAPAPAPIVVAPIFTWTGFYVGVNAGYGGNKFRYTESYTYDDTSYYTNYVYKDSYNSSGFLGGGQIGYNWQFANRVVIGLEADYQFANIEGAYSYSSSGSNGYRYQESYGSEITSFGTVRARLGYAAFDRALFYVTGGWAYGRSKAFYNYGGTNYDSGKAWSRKTSHSGWTVGGGVEYAFTNNVTFKTEYLYVDLGNKTLDSARYDYGKSYRLSRDTKFHVVRAGLNYKFGWGSAAAPVVARY
ncbi:MAG: outer membrane protein [Beijerinckiaceae bacterium]